ALDAIDHFQVRTGGRFDDVRADARTAIAAPVVLHREQRFSLRILSDRNTVNFELADLYGGSGRGIDRLDYGIDGPFGAHLLIDDATVGVLQRDRDAGSRARLGFHRKALQGPRAFRARFRAHHERFDVPVEQLLFLVGEGLEFLEQSIQLRLFDPEAELFHAFAECVTAAVLAEHEVRPREADVLRTHDFVGGVVAQHAVLVNAGFVRERVLADDRLVARNRHAGDLRNETAGRIQPRR